MTNYLVSFDHAEHEILSRFHDYIDSFSGFLGSCGIEPRHAWYLIEIPTENLVSSIRGEVDILAGNLEPTNQSEFEKILSDYSERNPTTPAQHHYNYAAMALALQGGLKWPPSLEYLVGIEVKSSYLPMDAQSFEEMRSTKTSKHDVRKIRLSVDKLLKIGFDRVGLFEFLATPPADGIGSQPWFIASRIAGNTIEAMRDAMEKRLSDDSPAGHGVCAVSGINGREEWASGSLSPRMLRQAKINPFLGFPETKTNRSQMNLNLASILQSLPRPFGMPAVFIYDKTKKTINYANEGHVLL